MFVRHQRLIRFLAVGTVAVLFLLWALAGVSHSHNYGFGHDMELALVWGAFVGLLLVAIWGGD